MMRAILMNNRITRLIGVLLMAGLNSSLLAQDEPLLPPEAPAPPSAPAPAGPPNTGRALYESIVRIENASLVPDYKNPWNAGNQSGGSGTGFLIGPNRFLTNAHVVSNSLQLLIEKYGDSQKYAAKVLHIAHDCDLALLELEDPGAFDSVRPLEIGEIPKLESTVTAIGYPVGGRRLSTTRGVVSRIDFQPYSHSGADLHLTVQVDAAINPGNSGGPVMQDGKVVGVAFQGISGAVAQNVGYMIPSPVMQRFLKDVEDGEYDHYVDLAVGDFDLINPAYRLALGLPANSREGTLVASVTAETSAAGVLEEGDVLMSINGLPIASNGYVEMNGEFVDMNEIVERKFKGDTVDLTVWRDGKEMDLTVELKAFDAYRMQANRYNEMPRYVMFAGLVFQPLDKNLMAAHDLSSLETRYLYTYYVQDEIFLERPEIIILTNVLPDAINTGYRNFNDSVVEKINGVEIKTLQNVYDALHPEEDPEFFVIECMGKGLPIVVESARVEAAQQRIQRTYEVSRDHYLGENQEGRPNEEGDLPVILN